MNKKLIVLSIVFSTISAVLILFWSIGTTAPKELMAQYIIDYDYPSETYDYPSETYDYPSETYDYPSETYDYPSEYSAYPSESYPPPYTAEYGATPYDLYPGPSESYFQTYAQPCSGCGYPSPDYDGYPSPDEDVYETPVGGTYENPVGPGGYTAPYETPGYSGYPVPGYGGYPLPSYTGYPAPAYGSYPTPNYTSYPAPYFLPYVSPYAYPLPSGIRGDIYAFGPISNLTVYGPSVVSTGSTLPPSILPLDEPQRWIVTNYTPRLVATWKSVMDTNLSRLLAERARTYAGLAINPNNRIGGEVWKVSGSLSLGGADFYGPTNNARGTIIVDGDVTVSGDLSSPQPVGIVSRNGSITIGSGVNNLSNLYFYAPNGSIIFVDDPDPLSATGSFIARSFTLPPRDMTITYSTKVALQPPPGFVSFILPTILERAP